MKSKFRVALFFATIVGIFSLLPNLGEVKTFHVSANEKQSTIPILRALNPGTVDATRHPSAPAKHAVTPPRKNPQQEIARPTTTATTVPAEPATLSNPAIISAVRMPKEDEIPSSTGDLAMLAEPSDLAASFPQSTSPRVVLAPPSPERRHTGYKVVIDKDWVIAQRIPQKGNFESRIAIYENASEMQKGWFTQTINHINTHVRRTRTQFVFYFQLAQLPQKPFVFMIGGTPVDGREFMANAEPFDGRFPGPRAFTRVMGRMGKTMLPYAIGAAITGNPFVLVPGILQAVIPAATATHMRHSADNARQLAEANFQKVLQQNRQQLENMGIAVGPGIMPAVLQTPGGMQQ
ncbi:MAG: hypothetical protein P4L67_01720 [Candidatus Pacebacteria bacterium]|nr:hypothetical protein [Candidatus Paceibacterota bacterium]